ncbi:MAG: dihydrofolate reductase [Bacteroidetes bacterium]|nr:dihydrofolate reductase [Bacteroidota bacterium]
MLYSCGSDNKRASVKPTKDSIDTFKYLTEQFGEVKILRFQIPNFDSLTLKQKELVYYLYEASLSGRDMIYDQNYKYNLCIRRTLEEIVNNYSGDKNSDDFKKFMVYTKKVWYSNGIHDHYSTEKFLPEISTAYFAELVKNSKNAKFPLQPGQTIDKFIEFVSPLIFDPKVGSKRVDLDPKTDNILNSANNFYDGLTQKEVEAHYNKLIDKNDPKQISHGLNSKMVKENGKIVEKTWKVGGMYTKAIEPIVFWLEKATGVAENENQKASLLKLIEFLKTGDLKTFDEYSILWVKDTESVVDVVNGFIEVYGDAIGRRGSYESMVSIIDIETSKRVKIISENAQWFEQNSSISAEFKKKDAKGISAKAINVIVESGDCSPVTPIGVNLPNSEWIRKDYGSKSVSITNITNSYDAATRNNGALEEFSYSKEESARVKKFGVLGGNIHTDLHEVIGHGSGQIKKGVSDPNVTLKSYASCLEEARADLVALYFIMDPKLVELKVMPSLEVGKAEYDTYIRNAMIVQLVRLDVGKNIEESHMRNRLLIAKWAFEKGKAQNVIEKKIKEGKTFFVINDYQKLRGLFGELLKEIQRVKSEGDYKAGKDLVENYGVKVDLALHKEVKERWKKLNIAPYSGFINPMITPVMKDGKIIDVKVEYPDDFTKQMLYYAKKYSFLPTYNN